MVFGVRRPDAATRRRKILDAAASSPDAPAQLLAPRIRLALLVVLAVSAGWFASRGGLSDLAGLQQLTSGVGPAGPILFALAYAAAATLLLPAAPFTIGAGVLFGPLVGTVTALAGATLGATGAFTLGRSLGRGAVERYGGARVAALDRILSRRGFQALLVMRLVPVFPFNLLNVGAGVTALSLPDFVVATILGIVPGTVVYAALGGTLSDPGSAGFVAAAAALIAITIGGGLLARRWRANRSHADVPMDDARPAAG